MILVDTSVWIDHLHSTESHLVDLLGMDEVGCHPLVIEELALGSIKDRATVLDLLGSLRGFPNVGHEELLLMVDRGHLWGRGLSAVDAHLMAAVLIEGGQMWTRDKRLRAACTDHGVPLFDDAARR
ncbi:type II toxin-antitoxin system VapC family toxin [Gordonia sp. PKS22-38]|uniref:Ribonuclease VapC n=1 Tax=Gordonia prachuapensis TaxID=3115651 RepID=A0ABU7MNH4_9ACTN|nr:type II toxin-antitoxin system VapC family toxin [Gordonia sp. PKS22-38]